MKRRNFIQLSSLAGLGSVFRKGNNSFSLEKAAPQNNSNDREYWVNLLVQIAHPVLINLSKGQLRKNMPIEYSATWDGRNKNVAYLEAFGRLLAGLAPWFNAKNLDKKELEKRDTIHQLVLDSIAHSVDPKSPDYMLWYDEHTAQPLVDAAYFAQALLRSPSQLWEPLSEKTKNQIIYEFKNLRKRKPFNNNWVLFASIIEAFLLSIGEPIDEARMDDGIDKVISWYVGDGWYSDGPQFAFDHYNGYDMHCMLVDGLKVNIAHGRRTKNEYEIALKRMQRYAHFQERFISPEGYFIVIGRSSTYRTGAFQPLAQLALEDNLPTEISPAQVRSGLTAVMKNVFIPETFQNGWLTLGLRGNKQADLADYYSNTGSMYITSLGFLPLGLSPDHAFWKDPFAEWTQRKAWQGKPFPKDYAVNY